MIRLIEAHRNEIPTLTAQLRARHLDFRDKADCIFSTAHKVKGLEFDQIRLSNDFPSIPELKAHQKLTPEELDDEVFLQYVALTRVRTLFQPNNAVNDVLTLADC